MTDTLEPQTSKPVKRFVRAEDKLLLESAGSCGATFDQSEVS
jgi:hypothetical protein